VCVLCWLVVLLQGTQAGGSGSKKESLEDWLDGF
jgi:hypothetical protein